jgi:hypothetical protein
VFLRGRLANFYDSFKIGNTYSSMVLCVFHQIVEKQGSRKGSRKDSQREDTDFEQYSRKQKYGAIIHGNRFKDPIFFIFSVEGVFERAAGPIFQGPIFLIFIVEGVFEGVVGPFFFNLRFLLSVLLPINPMSL